MDVHPAAYSAMNPGVAVQVCCRLPSLALLTQIPLYGHRNDDPPSLLMKNANMIWWGPAPAV